MKWHKELHPKRLNKMPINQCKRIREMDTKEKQLN